MTVTAGAILDGWTDASMSLPPQAARRFIEHEIDRGSDWGEYERAYRLAYDKRAKELR